MGEEECKDCRSLEEEIYWRRFQCIHFFQFLHPGFSHSLAIPEKFARNLRKKLPDSVSLKGPSGAVWKVDLSIENNILLLSKGWEEFANDHGLEEKNLLIFKYNGDSQFDVLIFDEQSMCEKETLYFVRRCGHAGHENGFQAVKNSDEPVAGSPADGCGGHIASDNGLEISGKSIKTAAEDIISSPHDVGGSPELEKSTHSDTDTKSLTSYIVRKRKRSAGENGSQSPRENVKNSGEVMVLTPEEVAAGEEVAGGVSSQLDAATIHETNTIPVGIPLNLITVSNKQTRKQMKQLLAKQNLPASEKPSTNTEFGTGTKKSVTKRSSIKRSARLKIKKLHTKQSLASNKGPSTSAEDIGSQCDIQYLGEKTVSSSHASLGEKTVSSTHASDRRPEASEEQSKEWQLAAAAAVAAMTDDSFMVVMKPSCVRKRFFMSIPRAWLTRLASQENQDIILRCEEKTWNTKIYYQSSRGTGGLSAGWKKFVVDNNLQESDVCVFRPENLEDTPVVLNVKIFPVVQEPTPHTPTSE